MANTYSIQTQGSNGGLINKTPTTQSGGMSLYKGSWGEQQANKGLIKQPTDYSKKSVSDLTGGKYNSYAIKDAIGNYTPFGQSLGYKNPTSPGMVTPTTTQPKIQTPTTPQVGTTQQNAQNVLNQATANPTGTGAAQASALYGMLGEERQLQPFAGGTTKPLLQTYADLTRPQSTGNFQGTAGLFDVQRGILQNAANTAAQQQIAQQQLATQGATSVMQAGLPQQVSPTNVPFNPLTGTYGTPASTAYGPGGLANVGAMLQQQQQGGDVQTMTQAYNMTNGLIGNFEQNLKSSGFNPSPIALANAFTQYVNGKVIPDPQYANMINTLTEIASTIAPVLGTPGNPSDLKTTISQELIPRLMQGQDIISVLRTLEANAQTKINQAKQTAQTSPMTLSSSSGTSGTTSGTIQTLAGPINPSLD